MNNTFTSSIYGAPLTVDVLREAMEKLAKIPKNDQWLIVTPEGQMYQGTVQQVLPFLVERHPMFKPLPLEINFKGPIITE